MLRGENKGLLGLATDRLCSAVRSTAARMPGDKIRRQESSNTMGAALIGMIWTAMACDEHGQQFAGLRAVARSYYVIKGRPDEHLGQMPATRRSRSCVIWARSQWWMRMTFLLATSASTAACLSRSRRMATGISWSIAHAATTTAGRSYGDIFAPTSKFSCIRSICAIAAQEGLTLYRFDVKGAFLLAECKERVYINLPGKYRLPKGMVLKYRRLIYGLKQNAHGWRHSFNV